jgi:Cu2+-exporting ATPase
VLHVGGIYRGSEHTVVMRRLTQRPGVLAVDANPVAQTATATYDPHVSSVPELGAWVEEWGYHCAGRSFPGHICDPLGVVPRHVLDGPLRT